VKNTYIFENGSDIIYPSKKANTKEIGNEDIKGGC